MALLSGSDAHDGFQFLPDTCAARWDASLIVFFILFSFHGYPPLPSQRVHLLFSTFYTLLSVYRVQHIVRGVGDENVRG